MPENHLMERIDTLVQTHGRKWKKIVSILNSEGHTQDDGTPLTVDTVRKRYQRWLKNGGTIPKKQEVHSGLLFGTESPESPVSKSFPEDSSEKSIHTSEPSIPLGELLDLFRGSLERRDAMLAQKLENDTYYHEAEERIISLETRLEERLLKALKKEIGEIVTERVDEELKTMLTPGGSFHRDLRSLLSKQLEDKAQESLVGLLDSLDVSYERPPGPGRGHRGAKNTARFSATMEADVYERMKNLSGTFSSRLTAACQLYLRALEMKREHTE